MTITEITQLVMLMLAVITSFLAIFTFRRNKKIELENQLQKVKLEAFSTIVFEMNHFFTIMDKSKMQITQFNNKAKSDKEFNRLKDEFADELDEQIYQLHGLIVKNSVYFTEDSFAFLFQFVDNLLGKDENAEFTDANSIVTFINSYTDKQSVIANKAIDAIREELGLEKLNKSLYHRVN